MTQVTDGRILTTPPEVQGAGDYGVLANEFVALPLIKAAGVARANVLHMGAKGLLELQGPDGAPFLRPVVADEEGPLKLEYVRDDAHPWSRTFRAAVPGRGEVRVTYLAPPGCRGLACRLEGPPGLTLGVELRLGKLVRTVYSSREVGAARRTWHDAWTDTLVTEYSGPLPLLAVALGAKRDRPVEHRLQRDDGTAVATILAGGPTADLFITFAPDADGAGTTNVDMARWGWELLEEHSRLRTRTLLGRALDDEVLHRVASRVAAAAEGPSAPRVMADNLLFAYYFSWGRTIDTEQVVLVTSRSPRYYVSAAHWSRDSLLWAFPALLLADPQGAREALLTAYELYVRNAGVHSLYIDGSVLYPGFELDELCAFPIALGRYLSHTGDITVLEEGSLIAALRQVAEALSARRDPRTGLYETFLLPSDDPAHHPFVTYDNALAWLAARVLAAALGDGEWERRAAELREGIYSLLTCEGPYGRMFVGSANGRGDHVLYDEPPGSLELLTHYGFCHPQDEVYLNTVRWIYSGHNPHYVPSGPYRGPACPHVRHPWVLSQANRLLALADRDLAAGPGSVEARARLLSEEGPLLGRMDAGLACETIDAYDGTVRTGPAFATCAGFLAYSIYEAYGNLDGPRGSEKFLGFTAYEGRRRRPRGR